MEVPLAEQLTIPFAGDLSGLQAKTGVGVMVLSSVERDLYLQTILNPLPHRPNFKRERELCWIRRKCW